MPARLSLKNGIASLLLLAVTLGGCSTTPQKVEKPEFMFWPPAPDAPRVQFLTSISSSADIVGKQSNMDNFLYGADTTTDLPFERPYGIRMREGKLFVCDATAASVAVLDFRKKEVRVLGTSGQIHLSKPIDIAVAPDGTKYIADTGHSAVLVYDNTDRYAGRVAAKDMRPVSLAVHDAELFVSDIAGSKIHVFDRFNGRELRTIGDKGGSDGKFGGAMGLALDDAGNVFVNDIVGCRVQKFTPDGKFAWGIGGLGDHPGQFVRPKLMTVDSAGILYVVDFAFENVQMFDNNGDMLMFFGGSGSFPGAMDAPTGICVSDTDLDLFANFVHPAFQAQRLLFVSNNLGPRKINIYALGELKPGKTIADIAGTRIAGTFGFTTEPPKDEVLTLPGDATTQPATQPAGPLAAPSATQPAVPPATTQPTPTPIGPRPEEQRPF